MGDIDFDSYIGRPTGAAVVTVERAPVTAFAASVHDDNPVYRNPRRRRPPGSTTSPPRPPSSSPPPRTTARSTRSSRRTPPAGRNPMAEVMGGLMAKGGLILHGEQEFTYHRPVVVGEKLHHSGVVKDIYQKPTGDRTMTFMVIEDHASPTTGASRWSPPR